MRGRWIQPNLTLLLPPSDVGFFHRLAIPLLTFSYFLALTYHKVRLELAKKDEQRAREMPRLVDLTISPLQLIIQGLELEEQQ